MEYRYLAHFFENYRHPVENFAKYRSRTFFLEKMIFNMYLFRDSLPRIILVRKIPKAACFWRPHHGWGREGKFFEIHSLNCQICHQFSPKYRRFFIQFPSSRLKIKQFPVTVSVSKYRDPVHFFVNYRDPVQKISKSRVPPNRTPPHLLKVEIYYGTLTISAQLLS